MQSFLSGMLLTLYELFAWLFYALTHCVPIATLNQNKRSKLLYLGDAQITRMDTASNVVKCTECGLLKGFKAWVKGVFGEYE